jgi:4a-hydroxytetrahydrobiopterin dehydratase
MMPALNETQIQGLLAHEPEWKLENGKLVRDWSFKDFVEAMVFVNRIAALAEQAGHHPDIDIRYNKVRLGLVSHDAGGITERDAGMATRISDMAKQR